MAKEHELNFILNAQVGSSYQATFREAQAALGSYREEYNALATVLKDISAYERQAQAVKNTEDKLSMLKEQLANIKEEYERTGSSSSDLANKMLAKQHQIDKTTDALNNQQQKLDGLKEKLNEAGVTTDNMKEKTAELTQEMDALRKKEVEVGDSADQMDASFKDSINDMEGVLVGAGIVKLAEELADQLKACASASMEFEVGMAAVRRTVGGSEEEMAALGDQFLQMAAVMPITTSELTEIATTAGQLGIAQEDVADFTEVMAKLATTTDLSSDRAATLLAQFSNITQTKDFDRLGSTVAALGDSTATTASRIVEMSQGMAAAATVAGMSAQDVLGISAAVGALGGRVQTGATAMSQLITKMQLAIETGEGLEGYAQTANMTAQEFKRAWGEDAAGALNAFIQGLNDTERNGKTALAVLSDLGITNARQLRVFTGLANSGDMLTRTISLANQSWTENTALTEKASIMYDTTKAKMVTMQNQVNNLRIAVGDQFNPALGRLYEMIGNAAGGLTDFVKEYPEVARALGALTTGLLAATAALGAAKAGIAAFNLIVGATSGPVGWVALGVTALVTALGALALTADHSDDALYNVTDAIKAMDNAVSDANRQVEDAQADAMAAASAAEMYINRLVALEDAGLSTAASQEEYNAILDEISRLLPGINIQLDEQTGLVRGGAESLRELADEWKHAALMQVFYETISEKAKAWAKLQAEVADAEMRLNVIRGETGDIVDKLQAKEDRLASLIEKRNALTVSSCASTQEYNLLLQDYNRQINSAQKDVDNFYWSLSDGEREAWTEQQELTAAVERGREAMSVYEAEIADVENQMAAFSEGNKEGADSLEAMRTPLDDVLSVLDSLQAAYDGATEAVEKSMAKQFDFWDKADAVVATGTDAIMANLDSQAKYWTEYSANLDNLWDRNIDGMDAMLKDLADGSTDSAAIIAGMAGASDEEIAKIVESWQSLQAATAGAKDDLVWAQLDVEQTMRATVDSAKSAVGDMNLTYEARNAALQTINSYINTASSLTGRVSVAYAAVAQAAKDALQYGGMTGYAAPTAANGYPTSTSGYGHAGGTDYAQEGWRWVGEQGPELMYFQGGETVIPHTKSVEMLKNSGGGQQVINVTLAPSYQISGTGDATDIRAILEEHDRALPDKVTAILREAERDAVRRSYA